MLGFWQNKALSLPLLLSFFHLQHMSRWLFVLVWVQWETAGCLCSPQLHSFSAWYLVLGWCMCYQHILSHSASVLLCVLDGWCAWISLLPSLALLCVCVCLNMLFSSKYVGSCQLLWTTALLCVLNEFVFVLGCGCEMGLWAACVCFAKCVCVCACICVLHPYENLLHLPTSRFILQENMHPFFLRGNNSVVVQD